MSQHVPCLLVGLKSDLTLERAVDTQLGNLIGSLFGIQAVESNTMTKAGVRLLQKYFIQFIYSDRKMLLYRQQSSVKDNDHPITASLTDKSNCTMPSTTITNLSNDEQKNIPAIAKMEMNNEKLWYAVMIVQ